MAEPKKKYREGDDADPPKAEWFTAQGGGNTPPPEVKPGSASDPDRDRPDAVAPGMDPESVPPEATQQEQLYTAVLLVLTHEGMCMPVTNLKEMNLHHLATPHEVFRMCADVKDQISGVRSIGEILKNMPVQVKAGVGLWMAAAKEAQAAAAAQEKDPRAAESGE